MKIKFNTSDLLDLNLEFEHAKKLWLNIHKDDVADKEDYEYLFKNDKIVYTKDSIFDFNYLNKEYVEELFYLKKYNDKLFIINNVVGSTLEVIAENFDITELNKNIGHKNDFIQPILSDFLAWKLLYSNCHKYINFNINEGGIDITLNLANWK